MTLLAEKSVSPIRDGDHHHCPPVLTPVHIVILNFN